MLLILQRQEGQIMTRNLTVVWEQSGGERGGLPYITDGYARRNFQKKPLKVTILGVAPANFIP